MVNAVAIVHSKGIIHRDLKPCNFMICRGQMKLIDFGIANTISAEATRYMTSSFIYDSLYDSFQFEHRYGWNIKLYVT